MTVERATTTTGRIRRLRTLIERPADVWLLCRMLPWAVVLPLLKHAVRLDTLTRLMWMDAKNQRRDEAAKVLFLSRLVSRPVGGARGACYERSLLAYRFLSSLGADPKFVVAVKQNGGSVAAHAWVTIGGVPVGESDSIQEFVPVVVYGRGGLRENEREPLAHQ